MTAFGALLFPKSSQQQGPGPANTPKHPKITPEMPRSLPSLPASCCRGCKCTAHYRSITRSFPQALSGLTAALLGWKSLTAAPLRWQAQPTADSASKTNVPPAEYYFKKVGGPMRLGATSSETGELRSCHFGQEASGPVRKHLAQRREG